MSGVNIVYGHGYRVYSGSENKTVILLLLGGDKPSQKKHHPCEDFLRGLHKEKDSLLKSTTYREDLIEALKDSREAAAYRNAAMGSGSERVMYTCGLVNMLTSYI
jgi:hypothetical protein